MHVHDSGNHIDFQETSDHIKLSSSTTAILNTELLTANRYLLHAISNSALISTY